MKRHKFPIPKLFLLAALLVVIVSVFSWLAGQNLTLEHHFHDTYFIARGFYVLALPAFLLLIFAYVYYAFPKVFGRQLNSTLGYIHLVISFAGALWVLVPQHYNSIPRGPLSYYDYSAWNSFLRFTRINVFTSTCAVLLLLAQIIFAFNLIVSIFFGKRAAGL